MVDFRSKLRQNRALKLSALDHDLREEGDLEPMLPGEVFDLVDNPPDLYDAKEIEARRPVVRKVKRPEPTAEQEAAIDEIIAWARAKEGTASKTHGLVGLAGTGKTTVLAETTDRLTSLGVRVLVVAPTGRAALQLRKKGIEATTLHKAAYRLVDVDLESEELVFERRGQIGGAPQVVCCDESSMLEVSQLRDLRKLAPKILLVGDHGQLPPIGGPAALPSVRSVSELRTVHRQALDSGIIRFSLAIREGKSVEEALKIGAPDVVWGEPDRLPDIAITARHRERVEIGERMRHVARLMRGDDPADPLPMKGDRIVALANDDRVGRGWANGMVGSILEVMPDSLFGVPGHRGKAVCDDDNDRSFELYDNVLDSLKVPLACEDVGIRVPRGARPELSHDQRSCLFWWGWSLTCHKAQGSEWPLVLVNDRAFGSAEQQRAWRYTAATRASQQLHWT